MRMDDDQQPTQAAIEQLAKFLLEVSAAHNASDGNTTENQRGIEALRGGCSTRQQLNTTASDIIPVVVFVHDELVMELPVDANHTSEAERINITC